MAPGVCGMRGQQAPGGCECSVRRGCAPRLFLDTPCLRPRLCPGHSLSLFPSLPSPGGAPHQGVATVPVPGHSVSSALRSVLFSARLLTSSTSPTDLSSTARSLLLTTEVGTPLIHTAHVVWRLRACKRLTLKPSPLPDRFLSRPFMALTYRVAAEPFVEEGSVVQAVVKVSPRHCLVQFLGLRPCGFFVAGEGGGVGPS